MVLRSKVNAAMRPAATWRLVAKPVCNIEKTALHHLKNCAVGVVLSAGILCGQSTDVLAASCGAGQASDQTCIVSTLHKDSARATPLPLAMMSPPLLESTSTAPLSGVAAVAEEAEELVADVFHFLQHSVEAMGSKVHHLQVVHALERLEGVPLKQVVDMDILKTAMHPATTAALEDYPLDVPPESQAPLRLDAALDAVSELRLGDVVDVGKLADALQDVPVSDPLDPRALQREAIRIRRTVHWDTLVDAVRPQALREALTAFGSTRGSPFSELDMRAAVSAVRMDVVRKVLAPPKAVVTERTHSLESSGMWTWESM